MRKESNNQNTKEEKNKEKQQGKKRGTKSFQDKQKNNKMAMASPSLSIIILL